MDGFRFDLASALCRDEKGNPMAVPPLIYDIAKDPVLSKVLPLTHRPSSQSCIAYCPTMLPAPFTNIARSYRPVKPSAAPYLGVQDEHIWLIEPISDVGKPAVQVKLIAEPWDCGGLYQVGSFPNWDVWGEWNGKYRDDVRRFIKGDDGMKSAFATRLAGSADLYHVNQR